jgi:hypothetical protein
MTDGDVTHFGSDEELLSRYVLGRLDRAERERIDRHASQCPECMESLRREMLVAAGARRLGRDELKSELKRRLAAGEERTRWPRILSAAAALILVAGLGVYYSLFNGPGTLPVRTDSIAPGAGKSGQPAEKDLNAPAAEQAQSAAREKADETSAGGGPQMAFKQKGSAPAVSSVPERRRTEENAPGKIERSEPATSALTGGDQGAFWSEGIVQQSPTETGEASLRGALKLNEKKAMQDNALMLKSKDVKEESHAAGAPSRLQSRYLLRQQPANTLPLGRENAAKDQDRVPTLVEEQGGTTTMTLYLDSLVDERDLKGARVEPGRDDSVVVTVGAKKIMYRFPPGGAAQQQKTK